MQVRVTEVPKDAAAEAGQSLKRDMVLTAGSWRGSYHLVQIQTRILTRKKHRAIGIYARFDCSTHLHTALSCFQDCCVCIECGVGRWQIMLTTRAAWTAHSLPRPCAEMARVGRSISVRPPVGARLLVHFAPLRLTRSLNVMLFLLQLPL